MKVICYAYRSWALKIFESIKESEKILVCSKDYEIVKKTSPDLVFFIGWSYMVPEEIVNNYTCVCIHPSPLPKYRGGSPIQNQIINGEKESAVSLFIMDTGIDTGDIVYQSEFSLNGKLDDIFENISTVGAKGVNFVIENFNDLSKIRRKQDWCVATVFKRRKQSDSEIKISDFENFEPEHFYNKIRALNDPYPNAYIKCKNGKKLFLIDANYEE